MPVNLIISKYLIRSIQANTYVTMEEPGSRVVGPPSEDHLARWWDGDGVSSTRILLTFDQWRVHSRVIGSHVKALLDDLELVSEVCISGDSSALR